MFASEGFFACKAGFIAREAAMRQDNVYWHFSSKEETLAEGFGAVEIMTAEVDGAAGPASGKLDLLIDRSLALYRDYGDFVCILGNLMGTGPGTARFARIQQGGDRWPLSCQPRPRVRPGAGGDSVPSPAGPR
jgi:AcrR family transcriptional regulator